MLTTEPPQVYCKQCGPEIPPDPGSCHCCSAAVAEPEAVAEELPEPESSPPAAQYTAPVRETLWPPAEPDTTDDWAEEYVPYARSQAAETKKKRTINPIVFIGGALAGLVTIGLLILVLRSSSIRAKEQLYVPERMEASYAEGEPGAVSVRSGQEATAMPMAAATPAPTAAPTPQPTATPPPQAQSGTEDMFIGDWKCYKQDGSLAMQFHFDKPNEGGQWDHDGDGVFTWAFSSWYLHSDDPHFPGGFVVTCVGDSKKNFFIRFQDDADLFLVNGYQNDLGNNSTRWWTAVRS